MIKCFNRVNRPLDSAVNGGARRLNRPEPIIALFTEQFDAIFR